ncbi:MAG: hypothetical protein AAF368_05420 [Planctomycetota bacterium]
MHRLLLALLAVAPLGCATNPLQRVPMPELASPVNAEASRAVLIRSSQLGGSERYSLVYDGDREIGRLGKDSYLAWDHAPGRRLLQLLFDRPGIDDGGGIEHLVDYRAKAGETSYFEIGLQLVPERAALGKDPGPGEPTAARLTETEGRSRVAKASPARVQLER